MQDLILAAEERYWDAYELAVQGRDFAAIYLAGFTAEMLLKTAGFRFNGIALGQETGPLLGPARAFGQARFPAIDHESYHSLRFWLAYLEHKRADAGRPLDPALLNELRVRVARAYETWWVAMRYRSSATPDVRAVGNLAEVLTLLEDVGWIMNNHTLLWS
ncbi:hypothetical protein BE04_00110 [Sorangium cellulosum]|uniref:HEPN domain-containing protein n=2 Tax=Sorangium cellulosum TaxID=56 RepID=A0A150QEP0_SORCE|nr:hypothetical protein [Sorangium cellulosum]AGP39313.1 hypothetical protein SCE1572_35425 [Sorangium cellulosum So0157-2]KYF66411.1 hypothetical protein BE04_00110 [Sorangium cellulosum]